jgi:hypothetical protein
MKKNGTKVVRKNHRKERRNHRRERRNHKRAKRPENIYNIYI